MWALQDWFAVGTLKLQPAVASPLAGDIHDMEGWLTSRLSLYPFALPEATDTPAEQPVDHLQVLTLLEEFRQIALPRSGTEWANTLPRAPLTKAELKLLVWTQWERDELTALRQLADPGSVYAGLIVSLELARESIQMARSILRTERAAQVTLMSILGGTRLKAHFQGRWYSRHALTEKDEVSVV